MIFDIERGRVDGGRLCSQVFFGVGSLETDAGRRLEALSLLAGHPAKPPFEHLDMVDDMRRFVAQLASRNDATLQISSVEVADEFQATVPGIVLSRALRHFYPPAEVDDEK